MGTLFATTVANAKPAAKDYKFSDSAGLYLLVRPAGSKLWRFNYVHCGKHRTLAFGAGRMSASPMRAASAMRHAG